MHTATARPPEPRNRAFARPPVAATLRRRPTEGSGRHVADAPDVGADSVPGQRSARVPPDPASHADLLDALRNGDESAFVRVVEAWSPAMLRLARAHVSTYASAQEVVQETWLA